MNIKNNPPRRSALVWGGILTAGIIIIFFPTIIGLDGMSGGYAISTGGVFVSILGLVGTIVYLRLAKSLDRITLPENILAYWTYSSEEWKSYTEFEHRVDASGKRNLFFLVAAISVVVGIIFYAMVQDDLLIIALIILGIIAMTGITAYLSTLAAYFHNKKYLGETYIALDGVYLNRQVHVWRGLGNRLEEISFDEDEGPGSRIIIEYSAPGTHNRNSYSVRIPVPPGKESTAKGLVKQIASANLKD
jgi:hypothetical protein